MIRLPFDAQVSATGVPHDRSSASNGEAIVRTHRILAVDDNQDAVDILARTLQLKGHEVQTAYDGLAAVDMAARFKPDVVLLDIGLPRLSGYDVARRIRQQPDGNRRSRSSPSPVGARKKIAANRSSRASICTW